MFSWQALPNAPRSYPQAGPSNSGDNNTQNTVFNTSPTPDPDPSVAISSTQSLSPSEDLNASQIPNIGIQITTVEDKASNEALIAANEKARSEITVQALQAFGISVEPFFSLSTPPEEEGGETIYQRAHRKNASIVSIRLDFFAELGQYPELFPILAKYLLPKDFLNLYCISRDFHCALNANLASALSEIAVYQAKESAEIFRFHMYRSLCVLDPTGRVMSDLTNKEKEKSKVRHVPGPKWLQMVVYREKAVRDILACLARQGHRLPIGMSKSLKKMWLLMDIPTSVQRNRFLRYDPFWSDWDLYRLQMFFVKLDMRFNDPIDGPGSESMRKLFLGQKSLTPLRNLLLRKAYHSIQDVIILQVRYDYKPRLEHRGYPIWGVLSHEIGIGHLEGWGKGINHLMRPDELIPEEATRRNMSLGSHIMNMLLWGFVDYKTGDNVYATEEECYMSEDGDEIPIDSVEDVDYSLREEGGIDN